MHSVRATVARPTHWNATLDSGVVVGALCPACQAPEENAEAVINEATLDTQVDAQGRYRGIPRVWPTGGPTTGGQGQFKIHS